jgi:hypothetical protein
MNHQLTIDHGEAKALMLSEIESTYLCISINSVLAWNVSSGKFIGHSIT